MRHDQSSGRAALGTLLSWSVRYRLPVIFAGDRALATVFQIHVREPDPAKRYKMIVKGPWAPLEGYPHGGPKLRISYSPDGIHWENKGQIERVSANLDRNAGQCDKANPDCYRHIVVEQVQ